MPNVKKTVFMSSSMNDSIFPKIEGVESSPCRLHQEWPVMSGAEDRKAKGLFIQEQKIQIFPVPPGLQEVMKLAAGP
jgi:hypothetical protein